MLSRFTLKKLLLLVCFLDKAKESKLIEHDPCLFCMDAEFKVLSFLILSVVLWDGCPPPAIPPSPLPFQFLNDTCTLSQLPIQPVPFYFNKTFFSFSIGKMLLCLHRIKLRLDLTKTVQVK